MDKDLSGVYSHDVEEIAQNMRREFLDEVAESLHDLNLSFEDARHEKKSVEDVVKEVRRFALPLRGQAGNFGVRLIGTVALRLDDFLANVKDTPLAVIDTLQIFVDTLEDIVEGKIPMDSDASVVVRKLPAKVKFSADDITTVALRLDDFLANVKDTPLAVIDTLQIFVDTLEDIVEGKIPMDSDASVVVRKLPAKVKFSADDITIDVRNVEVLLVMLHGAATRFVEREMQQCGYRIATVTTTFEALPLIVRTKPDLVIISAIMPELDGIDLAIAMAAMPTTRNIPTALITSLSEGDQRRRHHH